MNQEKLSSQINIRHVLIIDDNIDMANSLCDLLELLGHKTAVAYSGPDGLSKAHDFSPDVILCDIGLPGMDGYEVARALRSDKLLKDVLLIALSGYTSYEDQKRSIEAGFNKHISKPPTLEVLEEILK